MVQHEPPVLGMAVTLEEISWHEVDSCALAYGMAARQAIERILSPERSPANYEFIDSP
jgi:translation elongation factor EF-G